jgi:hypothetical protein
MANHDSSSRPQRPGDARRLAHAAGQSAKAIERREQQALGRIAKLETHHAAQGFARHAEERLNAAQITADRKGQGRTPRG